MPRRPPPPKFVIVTVDPVTGEKKDTQLSWPKEPEPDEACIRALWTAGRSKKKLRAALRRLLALPGPNEERASRLHAFWIAKGMFWLRECLSDDSLLLDAFRHLCRPYDGPGVRLYRGELAARYEAGILGFAWSSNYEVANHYAWRFGHLKEGPGIVLQIDAQPHMILAGVPNLGTIQEHEYIIDTRLIGTPTVIPASPVRWP